MHKHQKQLLGTGIAALAVGGVIGFAGASMLPHSTAPSQFSRGSFSGGTAHSGFAMRGGTSGNGLLTGTVVSSDANSVTLNTRDGSSHVVLLTPDTTVSKSVTGALSDISTGAYVIVSGTTNSDGSVSANLIQIRPAPPTPAPGQ